jgi:membrane protein YqaA with SNARE-associated domain
MGRVVRRFLGFAIALGAPGLFFVALLDSSILSLPEIVDFIVIGMIVRHKTRLFLYVLTATAGSLTGCLILYSIGRMGGEAIVRKRFAGPRVERATAVVRRYGVLAVLIPSILPPPAPFKIFVLLAGGARLGAIRFSAAVGTGRLIRYLTIGLLTVKYGDRATAYLSEHGTEVSLLVAGALGLAFVVYLVWCKARPARGR